MLGKFIALVFIMVAAGIILFNPYAPLPEEAFKSPDVFFEPRILLGLLVLVLIALGFTIGLYSDMKSDRLNK